MTIKSLGKYGCIAALFCAPYTTSSAAIKSPFGFSGNIDVFADDNVGKAQNSNDIREDSGIVLSGTVTYSRGIDRLSAFLASSSIAFEEYADFDGLSNTKFTASASYIFQRRISFAAPSYRLFADIKSIDSETDIRDRLGFSIGAEMKKRVTDKLRLNLGLSYSTEEAEGDVFDVDKLRLFTNLDLQYNPRTAIYSTLSYIDGAITSTATANATWALPFINYADAIEFDNAFGGEDSGQAAYRLDNASTIVLNFGTNIGIDRKSSIDFSLEFIQSTADGGIDYDRQIMRAVYLRRF